MYVMFPRRDGPINLIIVANPSTCVSLSASMCATDVCPCVCEHVCTCVHQIMRPALRFHVRTQNQDLGG